MNTQQTVLITGATSGIGRHTAIKMAKMGYHVIVHGRSQERIDSTVTDIKKENPSALVDTILCDFTVYNSIMKKFQSSLNGQHIDILINNAGVYNPLRCEYNNVEGTFVVNVIAPYLVTLACIPFLTSEAKLVYVSTNAHSNYVNLDCLDSAEYDALQVYENTKLCVISLAKIIYDKTHFTSIAIHPGSFNTELLNRIWGPYNYSQEDITNVVTSPLREEGFFYYEGDTVAYPAQLATDPSFCNDLRLLLEKHTHITIPSINH